jgi:hypothetical protein
VRQVVARLRRSPSCAALGSRPGPEPCFLSCTARRYVALKLAAAWALSSCSRALLLPRARLPSQCRWGLGLVVAHAPQHVMPGGAGALSGEVGGGWEAGASLSAPVLSNAVQPGVRLHCVRSSAGPRPAEVRRRVGPSGVWPGLYE